MEFSPCVKMVITMDDHQRMPAVSCDFPLETIQLDFGRKLKLMILAGDEIPAKELLEGLRIQIEKILQSK